MRVDRISASSSSPPFPAVLLWKRKAEKYLIDSGLPYTIVHPGGLLNEPGSKREIVIGVDDERSEGERSIPREDVAEVLVQAALLPAYRGRSFDIRSKLEGDGEVTTDFSALLAKLDGANCEDENWRGSNSIHVVWALISHLPCVVLRSCSFWQATTHLARWPRP